MIIIVSPFLILWPTETNFFAPGSGAWYAVPIIGEVTSIPVLTTTSQTTQNENTASVSNAKSGTEVTSPIIGTAYHAPEPGAKKFVEVGKKIKKGDTIMIVEAMKTMNHVPSTADGVVKEICVEDGHPVEFGQTIIILE